MKIEKSGSTGRKPKNYSRHINICTCDVPIANKNNRKVLKIVKVQYEITLNKDISKHIYKSYKPNFGEFSRILKIPEFLYKLDENDFVIRIGQFERDNALVPYVWSIDIWNMEKYEQVVLQEERRKKLLKIENL